MPTYVYACKDCSDRIEVMQRMTDAPLTECQKCGGRLGRVLFAPAVVYKGSGFYTTDYKNGGRKSDNGSSDNGSSGSTDTSHPTPESKTESKTEAKSEAKSGS